MDVRHPAHLASRIAVRLGAACLLLGGLTPVAGAAAAEPVDWSRHAEVETVTVVTTQADGTPRETTVWLAVVEGQGYIRTGSTRWGGDVEANRQVELVIGEERIPLRVEFVEDDVLRERITGTFREKYGWSDRVISVFRGARPKIMKLLPRETVGRGGGTRVAADAGA